MCSRTRENNENKVDPILWDTLYLMSVGDETYFKNLDNTGLEVEVKKQDNTSWSLEVLTDKLVFDYRDIRW